MFIILQPGIIDETMGTTYEVCTVTNMSKSMCRRSRERVRAGEGGQLTFGRASIPLPLRLLPSPVPLASNKNSSMYHCTMYYVLCIVVPETRCGANPPVRRKVTFQPSTEVPLIDYPSYQLTRLPSCQLLLSYALSQPNHVGPSRFSARTSST